MVDVRRSDMSMLTTIDVVFFTAVTVANIALERLRCMSSFHSLPKLSIEYEFFQRDIFLVMHINASHALQLLSSTK